MREDLQSLSEQFRKELRQATSLQELEEVHNAFLGRKGSIPQLMQRLREADPAERPHLGREINDLKESCTKEYAAFHEELFSHLQEERFQKEKVDVTLPGEGGWVGGLHPITYMMERIIQAHIEMGFSVEQGSDVDTDYYNFEALNFPKDHPAREMHDTFYLSPDLLLRTQTSTVQVRVMEESTPPIRILSPGRCYRHEEVDATHHLFFHQVEGFYVDRDVSLGDLLATLNDLLRRIFNQSVETRIRPSYFPFVEPGLEVDVQVGEKWLEVLGAGMVHPEVLRRGGIDPETYTGYAWAFGVERLLMIEYGIPDIRLLSENDTRFLQQFSFI